MTKRYAHDGQHLFICDTCGTVHYSSNGRMQWDNLFVCKWCYEPRQPQDFVRGRVDKQTVDIARPESPDQFITIPIAAEDL